MSSLSTRSGQADSPAPAPAADPLDEACYRLAFDHAPIGIAVLDAVGTIERVNERLAQTLGLLADEVRGQPVSRFVHPDDREQQSKYRTRLLAGHISRCQVEERFLHSSGTVVPTLVTISLARSPEGRPRHFIQHVLDVTAAKRASASIRAHAEELRALALLDELTELYNRRGFFEMGQQLLEEAQLLQRPAVVVVADLDGLKAINDELGHEAGDAALEEAAEVLRDSLREADVVGRVGGDEFAAVAMADPGATGQSIRERLYAVMEARNQSSGRRYPVAFSVGIEVWRPGEPKALDVVMQRADAKMYEEKRRRKGV